MAERRQFPVEHGGDARLRRMDQHVAHAVVAVDDHRLVGLRRVFRQPLHQLVHRRQRFGLRRDVLLAPARDLPRVVVAGFAETLEADGAVVDAVQRREHAREILVDGAAFGVVHRRQQQIGEHAPRDFLHHVELRADHRRVFAQRVHLRHRHVGVAQRMHHAIFAVDLVRGRQQFAGRLFAQHVLLRTGAQRERRIALTAFELTHGRARLRSLRRAARDRHRARVRRSDALRVRA